MAVTTGLSLNHPAAAGSFVGGLRAFAQAHGGLVRCGAGAEERRLEAERLQDAIEEEAAGEEEEEADGESDDFFFSSFGLLTGISSLGLLFALPRLVASSLGIESAPPMDQVTRDVALNAGVTAFFGFLTKLDLDNEGMRRQSYEEKALGARLLVRLPGVPALDQETPVRLDELLSFEGKRASRAVLCVGSADFCSACVESVAQAGDALARADALVVPVPLTAGLLPDEAAAASVPPQPRIARPALPSEDWTALSARELERAREQGTGGERNGLSIVLGREGQVQGRFLGAPLWEVLAGPRSQD